VLRTEQESWAEVRDSHDSRLLYESVPAGRTLKIEGEAPLSVFLGNADGVKVEYNGRPYDISRHKRGLVARCTLGASPQAPAAAADAPTP
jgi:cytoskeleton protein RodZ